MGDSGDSWGGLIVAFIFMAIFIVVLKEALGLFGAVLDEGTTFFASKEERANFFMEKNGAKYVNILRYGDSAVDRYYSACALGNDYRERAILMVPYLIESLGDDEGLSVQSGNPVNGYYEVGQTTPSDCALSSLKKITDQDFGKDKKKWEDWWDSWWQNNRNRFNK
jgi:hypothetical protein